jgi:hypothetical protein
MLITFLTCVVAVALYDITKLTVLHLYFQRRAKKLMGSLEALIKEMSNEFKEEEPTKGKLH